MHTQWDKLKLGPQRNTPNPNGPMAKDRNYSNHQKKIIGRYYENREQIDQTRLAELVTNLYLAEGKKRAKHWETAADAMRRLNVPEGRIAHVVASDDPAILAEVVNDLQAGRIG